MKVVTTKSTKAMFTATDPTQLNWPIQLSWIGSSLQSAPNSLWSRPAGNE